MADSEIDTVREARKIPGIKIVSFDWLEDSLMTKRARNERPYLMGPMANTAKETKTQKKIIRKKNITKGCKSRSCFRVDLFGLFPSLHCQRCYGT